MLGLSKKQWRFILIAMALVFLVNSMEFWQVFPHFVARNGDNGCKYKYRWGEIIFETINTGLLLSALAWSLVFVSRKKFIQRLSPILKYGIELLPSVFTGIFFAARSITFSGKWYDSLWCGFHTGPSESPHVIILSEFIVFPVVSALIFRAMYISNQSIENDIVPSQGRAIQNLDKTLSRLGLTVNHFVFLNWLVPLLIILSPTLISFATALLVLRVFKLPHQEVLQFIGNIVLPAAPQPTVLMLPSVIPLLLCTVPSIRKKLRQSSVTTLAVVFSVLSSISLWAALSTASTTASGYTHVFTDELVDFVTPVPWVFFIIGCGIALIVLNFIVIIGRRRTE